MPHDHHCASGCGCGPQQDHGPRPDVARFPPPWRPAQKLRVISIGIFRRDDYVLAGPVYDDQGQIKGWRPLGGEVEFGETAADALRRELREETGQEITDLQLLGPLENIYQHHGDTGHELVMVYQARFVEEQIYQADQLSFAEQDGIELHAKWIPIAKAKAGRVALFPEGLADML
jgi:ADP-ribose pyrophosphatase YjhB (NUDIX family)